MLDSDLAQLYQTETKQLKRQVRRNLERFPEDFMFILNKQELEDLRCQSGTSSWGGTRYLPMAFTEQGIAMLSSVLSSPNAVQVNIQIIRVFTELRKMYADHRVINEKLKEIEKRVDDQDGHIEELISFLRRFLEGSQNRKPIGFNTNQ
jgi:phage regulator Rha-like protein